MKPRTADDAIASVHHLQLDLLGAADEARRRARATKLDGSMRATSGHYLITAFKMDALYRAIGEAMDAGLPNLLRDLYARESIDWKDEVIDAPAVDSAVTLNDGAEFGREIYALHNDSDDESEAA